MARKHIRNKFQPNAPTPLSHDELLNKFRHFGVSERLGVSMLMALEFATSIPYQALIDRKLSKLITDDLGIEYYAQFQRDLKVYGLLEAILYLHGYGANSKTIDDCLVVYEIVARAFREAQLHLSADPRIGILLQGAHIGLHELGAFSGKKYILSGSPEPSMEPQARLDYKRRLPVPPFIEDLSEILPGNHEPVSFAHEIVEHIGSMLIQSSTGIERLPHVIAEVMDEHTIDPFSATGQWIISEICQQFNEEMFGGYDEWIYCYKCGQEFRTKASLSRANQVLQLGANYCENCLKDFLNDSL